MGAAFAEQVPTGIPEGDLLTPTWPAGIKWLPPGYSGGRTCRVPILEEKGPRLSINKKTPRVSQWNGVNDQLARGGGGKKKESEKQANCSLCDGRNDPELQSSFPKFTPKVLFASTIPTVVPQTYKTIKNYSIPSHVNVPPLEKRLWFSGMEFRGEQNDHFSWIF